MIDFVQATKADILNIYPQLPQSDPKALAHGKKVFEQDVVPLEGRAIAIREGGKCVGAYGFVEMWPGVARVWALFSEGVIKDHPALIGLHVKRDLEESMPQFGLHRIEATASTHHAEATRFLSWLGFTQECLMRRYSLTGEDMYLYAKVYDGVG